MNKQTQISMMILKNVAEGMALEQAYDAVMGDGAYSQLVAETYKALQEAA